MTSFRMWVLLLSVLSAGCEGYGYKLNEKLMGLNCRPEALQQHGSCVARKGAPK